MFDIGNWRDALHIGEWTTLAAGAAIGLGLLSWYVAPLRKLAIVGAVAVGCLYVGELHGNAVGSADKQAEWDAAKDAAAKAQRDRDAGIEQKLKQEYQPRLEALQKQADERKARADTYEKRIMALMAKTPAAPRCELGAAAVRLRQRR